VKKNNIKLFEQNQINFWFLIFGNLLFIFFQNKKYIFEF